MFWNVSTRDYSVIIFCKCPFYSHSGPSSIGLYPMIFWVFYIFLTSSISQKRSRVTDLCVAGRVSPPICLLSGPYGASQGSNCRPDGGGKVNYGENWCCFRKHTVEVTFRVVHNMIWDIQANQIWFLNSPIYYCCCESLCESFQLLCLHGVTYIEKPFNSTLIASSLLSCRTISSDSSRVLSVLRSSGWKTIASPHLSVRVYHVSLNRHNNTVCSGCL